MRTTTLLLLVAAIVLACAGAFAQNPNLGTSGAQFLQIAAGARETAMGGATASAVRNAAALFWNPAGIVHVPSNDLFFAHTTWWATIDLNHAAYVHTFEDLGSVGVFMTVLSMDPMEITTELEPDGTGEQFDSQDLMIGVSYARYLTEDFAVGLSVKYINQRIWNEVAAGVAFDVGTQFRLGFRDLTLAMSMTNFGPDIQYDGDDLNVKYDVGEQFPINRLSPAQLSTEQYALPLYFQVGMAMTVVETDAFSALLAADFAHPNDNQERVNFGTELTVVKYVALRAGYKFGYDVESLALGAGVQIPLGGTALQFDYAYAFHDLLPDIHRISLGFGF